MNCPWCGGPTKVIDTEKYDSTIVRVRKCVDCGAAETTDEVPRRLASNREGPPRETLAVKTL